VRNRIAIVGLLGAGVIAAACGNSAAGVPTSGPKTITPTITVTGKSSTAAAVGRSATTVATTAGSGVPQVDWPTFDFNAQRSGVGPANTGITAKNLHKLRRQVVRLDGTVDSAPIELSNVSVDGRVQTVIILTTSYGHTMALNANSGKRLWQYTPSSTRRLEGSAQVTTSIPIADPDRQYVYAASPDGFIQKLRLSNGRLVWRTRITYNPSHEKMASALNISGATVIAATDGYFGDTPPYEGHVVTMNRSNGHITHVWNSLCSNIHTIINPTSRCPQSDSAIWGRPGTVIEPGTGRILVATSNGEFNGRTYWGDSVVELSSKLKLLHNFTPKNQYQLNVDDWDLGSTSPALLPVSGGRHYAVQGGKQGILYLLNLGRLDGTTGKAGPRTGGQVQKINAPGMGEVVSQPLVWNIGHGRAYVFVANDDGTAAYLFGANHRLKRVWQQSTPGTSPVLAGGLLYVYDMNDGGLDVRDPRTGKLHTTLATPPGHWNSPIVVGGRVIIPVGSYFNHQSTGLLYIYHLPGY
jgi:outer membrane protein assembly factor BamB